MREDRKRLAKTRFDSDAADYDKSRKYAWVRAIYPFVIDEALRYQFQTFLDVGCGTGALLSRIGEQRKDVQLFGIDLSEEMIKVARAKLGNKADLRVSDSEQLPFEDSKFDLITCTYSFHHYSNPSAVLTEMKQVLSGTGKLILVDPWIPTPIRQIFNLLSPLRKEGVFYSKREMHRLVNSVGLEVTKWLVH
jgi:ubiquinone/menaquinone biosynthesis C-methylase UbiE